MSGSSYWPMSAVYVHGTAPLSRIQATATEVSRPPEKAMPTRSPVGREVRTLDMARLCNRTHDHARPSRGRRTADVTECFSWRMSVRLGGPESLVRRTGG